VPRTRRRRPRKNPESSTGRLLAGMAAGAVLVWVGRKLTSPAAPPAPAYVPPPPPPGLPIHGGWQGPPSAPAMNGGVHVGPNGILTVPLPEESAARSRSVRKAPPPPPPPPPSRRNTDEGLERDADHGGQHEDSGEDGGGRLGGEKF
jgi:hypothetical protein